MLTMRRPRVEPFRYETLTDNEAVYRARLRGDLVREPGAQYRLIDVFSGAGGLTLGFTQSCGHAFVPVWANDFNKYAARTYNANFGPHCTTDDILEVVEKHIDDIPRADVVIGGPPCQGFSLLNKQRHNDPRKQLWRQF
jgi:DNA (cytosine-5)-methyltransferase 1